jgi:hypothetical protein
MEQKQSQTARLNVEHHDIRTGRLAKTRLWRYLEDRAAEKLEASEPGTAVRATSTRSIEIPFSIKGYVCNRGRSIGRIAREAMEDAFRPMSPGDGSQLEHRACTLSPACCCAIEVSGNIKCQAPAGNVPSPS